MAPPVLLSDGPASNSLSRLHGSDAPVSAISSDPPELMRQAPPQQWPPSRVRTSANSVVTPPMSNERNKRPSRTSSNRGRCLADTVFPAPQAQESSQSFSPAQRLGIGSRAALASAAATPSHEVQRNASAGPSRTHDDLADGGTYAVVGAMPRDPKKRQRQEDVFRSVQPVYGEGPFGYYNTNDAGMSSGRRETPMGVPKDLRTLMISPQVLVDLHCCA